LFKCHESIKQKQPETTDHDDQDKAADGEQSNFNKPVSRETADPKNKASMR
jgi:hypothetical protein